MKTDVNENKHLFLYLPVRVNTEINIYKMKTELTLKSVVKNENFV